MAGLHKSDVANPVLNWIDQRLPIFTMMQKEYGVFPTPKNFNYLWNFGALATIALGIMIVTGIFLAMHYVPDQSMAFDSVEHIMRDVNYGWLLRYVHMNGASFFFIVVYVHIFRGMYYGSYKAPRELLWMIGVVLLLLMMATAFMGYVLPWGQMSFWGATVITNLFSAIPVIGQGIVTWLWGGFAVGDPTLNRFFSLHYLLPFVIVGVIFLHITALHITGSNNPLGIDVKGPADTLPFHPYYTIKDSVGMCVFLLILAIVVFFMPNALGDPNNYIQANPLQTPADIVPEVVLPAVLRDPAIGAEQAGRRHLDVRLDRGAVRAAVAGHQPGAQRPLPADLPSVDDRACGRRDYPGRCRRPSPRAPLDHHRPRRHDLLLPALPGLPANPRQDRADAAAARKHQPPGDPRRRPAADGCCRQADGEAVMRPFLRLRLVVRLGLAAAVLAGGLAGAAQAQETAKLLHYPWKFSGPFGTFDRASAQRGFEIYKEVCSNCHSLKEAYYRNLEGIGFSAAQVKAIAAGFTMPAIADDGSETTRPALPSDHFHSPFANDNAARAANNGALPPDQSVLEKAREGGPNYIYSILQGYGDAPAGMKIQEGLYYNKYFPGNQIAMPPPLQAGQVTYTDGTKNTLAQEAHDITVFLTYIANPEMEQRKRIGVKIVIFLLLLTGVTYGVKRKVWADVH